MRWPNKSIRCVLSQQEAFLKGILKPEDEITTEEMISSSEEVQDVGEGRIAFQFKSEYRKYVYAPKYNEYAD